MKREPDYKLKKRLERMEHEKKMNRIYNRNWIICIKSSLNLGVSCGVEMIRISLIPALIRTESG